MNITESFKDYSGNDFVSNKDNNNLTQEYIDSTLSNNSNNLNKADSYLSDKWVGSNCDIDGNLVDSNQKCYTISNEEQTRYIQIINDIEEIKDYVIENLNEHDGMEYKSDNPDYDHSVYCPKYSKTGEMYPEERLYPHVPDKLIIDESTHGHLVEKSNNYTKREAERKEYVDGKSWCNSTPDWQKTGEKGLKWCKNTSGNGGQHCRKTCVDNFPNEDFKWIQNEDKVIWSGKDTDIDATTGEITSSYLNSVITADLQGCKDACSKFDKCKGFNRAKNAGENDQVDCYLKSGQGNFKSANNSWVNYKKEDPKILKKGLLQKNWGCGKKEGDRLDCPRVEGGKGQVYNWGYNTTNSCSCWCGPDKQTNYNYDLVNEKIRNLLTTNELIKEKIRNIFNFLLPREGDIFQVFIFIENSIINCDKQIIKQKKELHDNILILIDKFKRDDNRQKRKLIQPELNNIEECNREKISGNGTKYSSIENCANLKYKNQYTEENKTILNTLVDTVAELLLKYFHFWGKDIFLTQINSLILAIKAENLYSNDCIGVPFENNDDKYYSNLESKCVNDDNNEYEYIRGKRVELGTKGNPDKYNICCSPKDLDPIFTPEEIKNKLAINVDYNLDVKYKDNFDWCSNSPTWQKENLDWCQSNGETCQKTCTDFHPNHKFSWTKPERTKEEIKNYNESKLNKADTILSSLYEFSNCDPLGNILKTNIDGENICKTDDCCYIDDTSSCMIDGYDYVRGKRCNIKGFKGSEPINMFNTCCVPNETKRTQILDSIELAAQKNKFSTALQKYKNYLDKKSKKLQKRYNNLTNKTNKMEEKYNIFIAEYNKNILKNKKEFEKENIEISVEEKDYYVKKKDDLKIKIKKRLNDKLLKEGVKVLKQHLEALEVYNEYNNLDLTQLQIGLETIKTNKQNSIEIFESFQSFATETRKIINNFNKRLIKDTVLISNDITNLKSKISKSIDDKQVMYKDLQSNFNISVKVFEENLNTLQDVFATNYTNIFNLVSINDDFIENKINKKINIMNLIVNQINEDILKNNEEFREELNKFKEEKLTQILFFEEKRYELLSYINSTIKIYNNNEYYCIGYCTKEGVCNLTEEQTVILPLESKKIIVEDINQIGDADNVVDLTSGKNNYNYIKKTDGTIVMTGENTDIDVNTGEITSDYNKSVINTNFQGCQDTCNKFDSCKGFNRDINAENEDDAECYLKSGQGTAKNNKGAWVNYKKDNYTKKLDNNIIWSDTNTDIDVNTGKIDINSNSLIKTNLKGCKDTCDKYDSCKGFNRDINALDDEDGDCYLKSGQGTPRSASNSWVNYKKISLDQDSNSDIIENFISQTPQPQQQQQLTQQQLQLDQSSDNVLDPTLKQIKEDISDGIDCSGCNPNKIDAFCDPKCKLLNLTKYNGSCNLNELNLSNELINLDSELEEGSNYKVIVKNIYNGYINYVLELKNFIELKNEERNKYINNLQNDIKKLLTDKDNNLEIIKVNYQKIVDAFIESNNIISKLNNGIDNIMEYLDIMKESKIDHIVDGSQLLIEDLEIKFVDLETVSASEKELILKNIKSKYDQDIIIKEKYFTHKSILIEYNKNIVKKISETTNILDSESGLEELNNLNNIDEYKDFIENYNLILDIENDWNVIKSDIQNDSIFTNINKYNNNGIINDIFFSSEYNYLNLKYLDYYNKKYTALINKSIKLYTSFENLETYLHIENNYNSILKTIEIIKVKDRTSEVIKEETDHLLEEQNRLELVEEIEIEEINLDTSLTQNEKMTEINNIKEDINRKKIEAAERKDKIILWTQIYDDIYIQIYDILEIINTKNLIISGNKIKVINDFNLIEDYITSIKSQRSSLNDKNSKLFLESEINNKEEEKNILIDEFKEISDSFDFLVSEIKSKIENFQITDFEVSEDFSENVVNNIYNTDNSDINQITVDNQIQSINPPIIESFTDNYGSGSIDNYGSGSIDNYGSESIDYSQLGMNIVTPNPLNTLIPLQPKYPENLYNDEVKNAIIKIIQSAESILIILDSKIEEYELKYTVNQADLKKTFFNIDEKLKMNIKANEIVREAQVIVIEELGESKPEIIEKPSVSQKIKITTKKIKVDNSILSLSFDKPIRSAFTLILIGFGIYVIVNIILMILSKMNVGWATQLLSKARYVLPGHYGLPFLNN
jgi:hypothetical protein